MKNPHLAPGLTVSSSGQISAAMATLFTVIAIITFTADAAQAQRFEILYSFPRYSDGSPYAGLLLDSAGNLYGTAAGSACFAPTDEYGNVFEISSDGAESIVHSFDVTDGLCPFDSLIADEAGNLYGTTLDGGPYGVGNVFKLDPGGNETNLYNFNAGPNGSADGCYPYAGLLRDGAGNLYGTTSRCGAYMQGVVFKIDTNGNETVLHNFSGPDGAYPYGGLIMDAVGNLYGTTAAGGSSALGVLYKLTPKGKLVLLHSFTGNGIDGCNPDGKPLRDNSGNFFGTASNCGAFDLGNVWKIGKNGSETVLHNFAGGSSDGAQPSDAGLISDGQGNLYGVTSSGGPSSYGTVYKVSVDGTFTLLHKFSATMAGAGARDPQGSLVMDAKGNLYGTTSAGGDGDGNGTVWTLTP